MSGSEPAGVVFPVAADGRRSTSALGRAVVADALSRVDSVGALAAEREANWRADYLRHFRRLIEAGLTSKQAAMSVARDGLASLHQRMRVVGRDGEETALDAQVSAPARCVLTAVTVAGTGAAESELSVPYRGERLRGSALLRRLDGWVTEGVIEPSCADAVRAVAANPGWLALPGRTVVALGAGAEMGPLPALLANVRVASAVDALTVRLQAERRDVALGFLATPTDVFAVPARRGRPVGPRLRGPVRGDEIRQPAAADAVRWAVALLRLPARGRPGHLRRANTPAGAQLRTGQAPAALARHGRPRLRRDGVAERRPADPHPVGDQEPGAGGRVCGRAPVRRRGLRARYHQDAHGGPPRP